MFPYKWSLKDGYKEKNNKKVFSTFACGGGSTMGYKLAGYTVIGANDIDKKMAQIYQANHHPKYYYLEDIRTFREREDLPQELFDLDILDGSPPCSTFSMSGSREKAWNVKKKFREGQSEQTLDDLFFEFVKLTKKLQPKVFVAENVKGLLQGNAKGYVSQIVKEFDEAGYKTQIFLLNAATMGLPQKRERVFFIGHRKDLSYPKLKLFFNENIVTFGDIYQKGINDRGLERKEQILWDAKISSDSSLSQVNERLYNKTGYFKSILIKKNQVVNTILASDALVLYDEPRKLNNTELLLASSFPLDFNFCSFPVDYVVGMSVPPIMTANVADQIYKQWLT